MIIGLLFLIAGAFLLWFTLTGRWASFVADMQTQGATA